MIVWEPFSTALEQNGKSRREIKFGKENGFYVMMGSLNITRRYIWYIINIYDIYLYHINMI